ncbi:hypothetical protein RHMOL_Rhmol06G0277400 [Rhododendron molle]|uniref:Uncharacterized protein n=1 Tax=Rhododendron molle TaxID=49168 RepID=A0ACC0NIJ4_RHOML|nr:hypothetical protein RHMOL_Rhmol06G0277400 [Rhododendron molle]
MVKIGYFFFFKGSDCDTAKSMVTLLNQAGNGNVVARYSKKKKNLVVEILGYPIATSPVVNRGGRKKKNKSVVFRAAAVAVALPISSEGISNRNRILLNESQAVWQVNKMIKIVYKGSEDEVISKIMDMEQEDDDRAALLAAKSNAFNFHSLSLAPYQI